MLKDKLSLAGRTALVTGSARGIGRAIALGLAEAGAHLIVHGSRESAALDEAHSLVQKFDPSAAKVAADLGDPAAVDKLINELPQTPTSSSVMRPFNFGVFGQKCRVKRHSFRCRSTSSRPYGCSSCAIRV